MQRTTGVALPKVTQVIWQSDTALEDVSYGVEEDGKTATGSLCRSLKFAIPRLRKEDQILMAMPWRYKTAIAVQHRAT
jgi:hypothetical protein